MFLGTKWSQDQMDKMFTGIKCFNWQNVPGTTCSLDKMFPWTKCSWENKFLSTTCSYWQNVPRDNILLEQIVSEDKMFWGQNVPWDEGQNVPADNMLLGQHISRTKCSHAQMFTWIKCSYEWNVPRTICSQAQHVSRDKRFLWTNSSGDKIFL